ncbi:MAG: hypothetical protein A3F42_04980 [Gammaproteobacteria bacterium RIFCSPHIGHO2_12_FULL_37_34]|nr:MAG: hypothetical protein A3F42_04980 [Gammaproteobacteria bacterium RIFCSPHIGHO2_12_FULL_37_34]
MKKNIIFQNNIVYFFAIFTSLALSFWVTSHRDIINPDAICYLSGAEVIGQSGLHAAMQLCGQAKWPIYSLLIYGVAQLGHFSYPVAAYFLNGMFSLVSVALFILITKELGGSNRVLWLAAGTILLAHGFNSAREYIIRDHGFWAFYLLSFFLLLRYFRQPTWGYALFWNISMLLATLFRLEGIVFLFLLPFLSWICFSFSWLERLARFFKLNLLTMITCFLGVIWLLSYPEHTLEDFGRLSEVFKQIGHGWMMIAERYSATKMALANHVLTGDSAKEAGLVLFITILVWYGFSIMSNLSWVYSLLVIYAWWRQAVFSSSARLVLAGYLSINILVTLSFLFERLFLSKRYLIALSLILMLWVPFALDDLLRKRNQLIIAYASMFLIALSSLGGIFEFGYSKTYVYEAGKWLSNYVSPQATLYSNDYQVMYYSQHFGHTLFQKVNTDTDVQTIAQGKWKQYDYLALRIKMKHENEVLPILQEIHRQPIRVFRNKRGDRIEIYHLQ